MLEHLTDKVYDGSGKALMRHALSSKKATPQALNKLRQLIDELEDQQ